MNKIKVILSSVLLGMSLAGCEDTLFENVNPDAAHINSAELGLPVVVFYAQQAVYDNAEYNVYLSQCLTTTGKSQTGSYPYKQGWEFLNINRHPQWRRHFYDIGVNVSDLVKNAKESNSTNYEIIARAIYLMSTQLCTDAFGEMPMPGEGWDIPGVAGGDAYESKTPKYMTQPTIYAWMLAEADRIIDLYNANKGRTDFALPIGVEQDRIYAGDIDKWVGLVYAVKARLLLRNIPNVNTGKCQEIISTAQQAINIWKSEALYEDPWFGCEPRFKFDGGTGEQNCPWGPAQPKINSWESRDNLLTSAVPSKFFIEDCLGGINPGVAATTLNDGGGAGVYQNYNGYGSDPRLALLLIPNKGPISPADDSNVEHLAIRYLENNIGSSAKVKQAHYPDLYAGAFAKNDGYNPLFMMEELYFIQAEAYYWMGNKAKAMELAREATEYNIKRHLARFQADNAVTIDGKAVTVYPGIGNKASEKERDIANDQKRWERMVRAFLYNLDNGDTENTQGTWLGTKRGNTLPVTEIGNKQFFFPTDANEYTLEKLMTQKYIAMYMQPEQWNDLRRYHYSNTKNGYMVNGEIVYPDLKRPYNLYSAYWVDGYTEAQKENLWIQRLNYDPQTEDIYNKDEVVRLGAYKDHRWLQKPMIWANDPGVRTSLTAE
ncbi:MAG: SusD/RagB family nutrient-binding outer membrane lipoprotein [Muribaculaceae bacterium]|nr:SusD/RagB family nutrient-binding outer membrane lipoprotein [Muribaculaceae bacterium]